MTPVARKKPIIGLCGGIGAGKSEVARILASLGAAVIDSDRVAHQELQAAEVVAELRRWWGDGVLLESGLPDRGAIARVVFRDPSELRKLEDLLYPRLKRLRDQALAGYERDAGIRAVVLDAPKLLEAGLDKECDAVVFVDADFDTRLTRVATSRGWTESELKRRETQQFPLDFKRARADYVIANHTSTGDLRAEVERIFLSILASHAN